MVSGAAIFSPYASPRSIGDKNEMARGANVWRVALMLARGEETRIEPVLIKFDQFLGMIVNSLVVSRLKYSKYSDRFAWVVQNRSICDLSRCFSLV